MTDFVVGPNIQGDDALRMQEFNETLVRLRARRVPEIRVEGSLLKSKLAWKIATYQQPVLYRIVMLADGCALNWNARNDLCSFLAARALVETIALVFDFQCELDSLVELKDLKSIDALVMNRTFASRDQEWLKDHPDTKALNVLTFVDRLDKRMLPGVRWHYDALSECCHPNSFGHHQFFGKLDKTSGATTYFETQEDDARLNHVLLGAMLVHLAEISMDRLDKAITEVSKLQHEIDPVGGKKD